MNKNRIVDLAQRITANPASYDALCCACSLTRELEVLVAQTWLAGKDRLIFKRKGVEVTPVVEEYWHEKVTIENGMTVHRKVQDGYYFTIPGDYRDYVEVSLDGVVLNHSSSVRKFLVTSNGVY